MKKIMAASLFALGLAATTTTIAQDAKYHPRYRGDIAAKEQKAKPNDAYKKYDRANTHHLRSAKIVMDKDPNAIAINKTAALDKKVGLTTKQEKQVQRLYKKEAKQMVKLQEVRKENKLAMRDILTKEQMQKTKTHRSYKMQERKGFNKPAYRVTQYSKHKPAVMKDTHKPVHMIVIEK